MPKTITVHRKAYTDRFGHHHPASTYERVDVGAPGITPKEKRWFKPGPELDWSKDMPTEERREKALNSRDGDLLKTARALQALANVTADPETKRLANLDAKYFFDLYERR